MAAAVAAAAIVVTGCKVQLADPAPGSSAHAAAHAAAHRKAVPHKSARRRIVHHKARHQAAQHGPSGW